MIEESNKRKPDISITFRVYRMHDLPLLVLKSQKNVMFQNMVKKALKMFASGHITRFEISDAIEPVRLSDLPYVARASLNLYKPEDNDIIAMLSKVQDGYQTNFIKDVVMYCLYAGGLEPYFENPKDLDEVSSVSLRDKSYKQVAPLSKRGKDRLKKLGVKPKTNADLTSISPDSAIITPVCDNLISKNKKSRRGVAHTSRIEKTEKKNVVKNNLINSATEQIQQNNTAQSAGVNHIDLEAEHRNTTDENINPMGFFNNLM